MTVDCFDYPPEYRLRSKADFAAMRKGRRMQREGIRLVYRPNAKAYSRLGFAVSCKYGNSVVRHEMKRHIREVFRCHSVKKSGYDILIVPYLSQLNIQKNLARMGKDVGLQSLIGDCFDRIMSR